MHTVPRYFLLILFSILIGFANELAFPRSNRFTKEQTGQALGFKVVYVVDVSSTEKKYRTLIERTVEASYDAFQQIPQTDYHLITFSDRARMLETEKINKESILSEIRKEIRKWHSATYPKDGLNEVFRLVSESFPKKIGIVLFISSGRDSCSNVKDAKHELETTIQSLKKNGFTVFSIFIPISPQKNSYKEFMFSISKGAKIQFYELDNVNNISQALGSLYEEAINIELSSPIEISEMKAFREEMEEKLEYQKTMVRLFEKSEKELLGIIEKQNEKLDTFWILILLLSTILAFFLKKHLPFFHSKRKKLWGRLKLLDNNIKPRTIDLSRRNKGFTIKTPPHIPNFNLHFCLHSGRKILCAHAENGRVDYFKDRNQSQNGQYIDSETKRIKISSPDGEYHCEYEYHFLNVLRESCKNPAWEIGKFWGFKEIIDEIKQNFLKVTDSDNLIISGMGNSGKTSLLRHLDRIVFAEDTKLKRRCAVEMVEYNSDIHSTPELFEDECEDKINRLFNKSVEKRILFIDEYDRAFFRLGDRFRELITDYFEKDKIYLVLAGRRPGNLIHGKNPLFILPRYKSIVLNGIDKFPSYRNSIKLIDSLIDQIGFRKHNLSERVKREIVRYASGMPYFSKRILVELISSWLEDVNKYSINKRDVQNAALKIAQNDKDVYLKRTFAEFDKIAANNPNHISFQEVTDFISSGGKGRVKKNEVLTFAPSSEDRIDHLQKMGLIVEDRDYIIGIPRLFYSFLEEEKYGEIN